MTSPVELKVDVSTPYSVWVGAGILERAGEYIPLDEPTEMAVLAGDAAALSHHGLRAEAGLAATCVRVEREEIVGGESAKTIGRAEQLLRALASRGVHRGDLLVALGGGTVGDLVGFAAATYHRGTPFVQMPTTLLAQVDASIGGKTGVNLPEGKNLVGALHHPVTVIADVATLATLPEAEFRSGLAEVIKHGLIDDGSIIELLRTETEAVIGRDVMVLTRLIAKAAAVKVRVVSEDETERGRRLFLNYGHTLGHALEAIGGYSRWRHGEAVAIGMVFAARLAADLGYPDRTDEHISVLRACGLPTGGADPPFEQVLAAMQRDKKYRRGIRFVVLEDLGQPRLVSGIDERALRRAYETVRR